MSDLADLTAAELTEAYREGLSPVAVAEAVLARIGALEPKLCALYDLRPDEVMRQARASEGRLRDGSAGGLEGIPVTIKENIATRGTPVPLTMLGRARPARAASS